MLVQTMISRVAAEPDLERKRRLAAVMVSAVESSSLVERAVSIIGAVHSARTDSDHDAAQVLLESLTLVLVARVNALDEGVDTLVEQVNERKDEEAELLEGCLNGDGSAS